MPQVVKSNFLLYADNSCLMYQHKDFAGTEKIINKDFENISEWFVDNKLSIYFAGEINSFRKSVKG